jgi:hypothetical protein
MRELRREAEQLGYTLEGATQRQHLRWRNRHGVMVITSSNLPTDRHMRACETNLRRMQHVTPESILAERQK